MQARLQQAQLEIEQTKVEGTAGGGVVKVVMTGKQVLESVTISPEAAQDVDLLQDLVLAAVNDASTKVQDMVSKKMGAVTGGIKIPGLT